MAISEAHHESNLRLHREFSRAQQIDQGARFTDVRAEVEGFRAAAADTGLALNRNRAQINRLVGLDNAASTRAQGVATGLAGATNVFSMAQDLPAFQNQGA